MHDVAEIKPRAYGTRSHTATTPIHTLTFFSYFITRGSAIMVQGPARPAHNNNNYQCTRTRIHIYRDIDGASHPTVASHAGGMVGRPRSEDRLRWRHA
eukprot:scaffold45725_cov60-Phaeocystis_antarctica.AAC.1